MWSRGRVTSFRVIRRIAATGKKRIPTTTNWVQTFGSFATGAPLPDVHKFRASSNTWNYMCRVFPDSASISGKALFLTGSGAPATNGDSRPHIWTAVPVAAQQEILVCLNTTSTGSDAGGAVLSMNIGSGSWDKYTEVGCRLDGDPNPAVAQLQCWSYRLNPGTGLSEFQQWGSGVSWAQANWIPNVPVYIRLTRTTVGFEARAWKQGDAEPVPATFFVSHSDAQLNGITTGSAGFYVNTVGSGIRLYGIAGAINGAKAVLTGSDFSNTKITPTIANADFATNWSDLAVGVQPTMFSKIGTNTGVMTAAVSSSISGSDDGYVFQSTQTVDGTRNFWYINTIGNVTNAEILAKLKVTTLPSNGNGIGFRIATNPTTPPTAWAMAIGNRTLEYTQFVNNTFTGVSNGSVILDYEIGEWMWYRVAVEGQKVSVKLWNDKEPEPYRWTTIFTSQTAISSGSVGLYHYLTGTQYWDYFSYKVLP